MKKNIPVLMLFACVIGLLWSCNKKLELKSPVSATSGMAYVKIIHAAPAFRQILKDRDSFNIYVNNVKVNGSFITYATLFPTASNLYMALPAGGESVRITTNGVVNADSLTLFTLNKSLVAGNYYTWVVTDSLLSLLESRQMWLNDKFALTDTSHFTLRFINAVLNDPANVDVYSNRNGANIFTNISPFTVTAFNSLNYTLLSDTLIVRITGTTTAIATVSGAVFTRSRAYTMLYRGQNGGAGSKVRAAITYATQ